MRTGGRKFIGHITTAFGLDKVPISVQKINHSWVSYAEGAQVKQQAKSHNDFLTDVINEIKTTDEKQLKKLKTLCNDPKRTIFISSKNLKVTDTYNSNINSLYEACRKKYQQDEQWSGQDLQRHIFYNFLVELNTHRVTFCNNQIPSGQPRQGKSKPSQRKRNTERTTKNSGFKNNDVNSDLKQHGSIERAKQANAEIKSGKADYAANVPIRTPSDGSKDPPAKPSPPTTPRSEKPPQPSSKQQESIELPDSNQGNTNVVSSQASSFEMGSDEEDPIPETIPGKISDKEFVKNTQEKSEMRKQKHHLQNQQKVEEIFHKNEIEKNSLLDPSSLDLPPIPSDNQFEQDSSIENMDGKKEPAFKELKVDGARNTDVNQNLHPPTAGPSQSYNHESSNLGPSRAEKVPFGQTNDSLPLSEQTLTSGPTVSTISEENITDKSSSLTHTSPKPSPSSSPSHEVKYPSNAQKIKGSNLLERLRAKPVDTEKTEIKSIKKKYEIILQNSNTQRVLRSGDSDISTPVKGTEYLYTAGTFSLSAIDSNDFNQCEPESDENQDIIIIESNEQRTLIMMFDGVSGVVFPRQYAEYVAQSFVKHGGLSKFEESCEMIQLEAKENYVKYYESNIETLLEGEGQVRKSFYEQKGARGAATLVALEIQNNDKMIQCMTIGDSNLFVLDNTDNYRDVLPKERQTGHVIGLDTQNVRTFDQFERKSYRISDANTYILLTDGYSDPIRVQDEISIGQTLSYFGKNMFLAQPSEAMEFTTKSLDGLDGIVKFDSDDMSYLILRPTSAGVFTHEGPIPTDEEE